jgi:hypothetical protein
MKKTETLRQLAASSNEQRMADLGMQIEALRPAKIDSADHLASILEPIAQAMAALTDETRRTMIQMAQRSEEQAARFERHVLAAEKTVQQASMMADRSSERLTWTSRALELRHYVLAVTTVVIIDSKTKEQTRRQ